jgi:hypothetical protein
MHSLIRAGVIAGGMIAAIGMAAAADNAVSPGTTGAAPQAPAPATQAQPKPPLTLTDQERQAILAAVGPADTSDKLPEGFKPQVGAKAPTQKKLPTHPLPQALSTKFPTLKQYDYAKLEHQVLIVDPMNKTVVATIPR